MSFTNSASSFDSDLDGCIKQIFPNYNPLGPLTYTNLPPAAVASIPLCNGAVGVGVDVVFLVLTLVLVLMLWCYVVGVDVGVDVGVGVDVVLLVLVLVLCC